MLKKNLFWKKVWGVSFDEPMAGWSGQNQGAWKRGLMMSGYQAVFSAAVPFLPVGGAVGPEPVGLVCFFYSCPLSWGHFTSQRRSVSWGYIPRRCSWFAVRAGWQTAGLVFKPQASCYLIIWMSCGVHPPPILPPQPSGSVRAWISAKYVPVNTCWWHDSDHSC